MKYRRGQLVEIRVRKGRDPLLDTEVYAFTAIYASAVKTDKFGSRLHIHGESISSGVEVFVREQLVRFVNDELTKLQAGKIRAAEARRKQTREYIRRELGELQKQTLAGRANELRRACEELERAIMVGFPNWLANALERLSPPSPTK